MLSVPSLLEEAKRECGLADFGAMDFMEGLQVLVGAINTEAGLTEENEALVGIYLRRGLVNRLRMRCDVLRHPEIMDEEILPPVFISSLPRTGSTKLQRMLAASGSFHAMKFWQALNFAPFTEDVQRDRDLRIRAAQAHIDWIQRTSPRYVEAHSLHADEVDEELPLLDAGFNSLYTYAAYLNVPTYAQWVIQLDSKWAFENMREILQYMQWQHFRGQKKRWLLKTPALLGVEGKFAETFPGMDFIVTHRHPAKIIPSACGYLCACQKLYSDADYRGVAGNAVLHNFGETIKGHLQWREAYPVNKVIDVGFDEIMADEAVLIAKLHRLLGIPFDETRQSSLDAWLKMDQARGQAPNRLTLADFDIDPARVDNTFAAYIQRYAQFI